MATTTHRITRPSRSTALVGAVAFLALSCGGGGGDSRTTAVNLTVKARSASEDGRSAYRFELIGPRAEEIALSVEPGSPLSRATFELPHRLSGQDDPAEGAVFYAIVAHDGDVFTGLGAIAIRPHGTRYAFVDTPTTP
jgi:hypothetical protein